jgi:glycosyltransferase involved in cell wall biosynthesis
MNRRPWPLLLMTRELAYGGTERQLTEIAQALDPARFRVHVGCFRPASAFGPELQAAGVPVVEFPLRSLKSPRALETVRRMGSYLRRQNIRLVHTFDVPTTLLGVFTARFFGVPTVLSSQRAYRDLTSRMFRHILRLADRTVDGIVVNCEAMRRHLCEDEGVPGSLIHLCYNSIDTGRFSPGPRWRPPGLEAASLVIGTICVLRPEKGLPVLLDAFARVRGARPSLKLLIVGSGPILPELVARARDLGIREDCVFQPAVSDVPHWLHALDVFVLPSRSEALSNSLMEAMAAGTCVVASRVGGNPELVQHGQTGLLFAPDDVEDLGASLCRLIQDGPLRESLARAATRFVSTNFSRRAVVARMEAIYTGFLEPGNL